MRAQSHGAIALSPEESFPEERGLSEGVRTWNYGGTAVSLRATSQGETRALKVRAQQ
jgi:hypothetical protein